MMSPPSAHDSAVSPRLHGCLAFLQRHSPLRSSPSHPLRPSPSSQQQTSCWDCFPIPTPAPSCFTFQGTCVPAQGTEGCSKDFCVVLAPFRLSQMSCCILQQSQMLLLCPKLLPRYGDLTPASASPQLRCSRFNPAHPPSSFSLPHLSYQVLHGSIYSFLVVRVSSLLSAGVLQDLLHLKVYS